MDRPVHGKGKFSRPLVCTDPGRFSISRGSGLGGSIAQIPREPPDMTNYEAKACHVLRGGIVAWPDGYACVATAARPGNAGAASSRQDPVRLPGGRTPLCAGLGGDGN